MIRCKHWDRAECDAIICKRHTAPVCERYEPMRKYKAFGWVVTVRFHGWPGRPDQEFHWCGCRETDAKRKAMLKKHARQVLSVEPVATREEWERAYGVPELRGL